MANRTLCIKAVLHKPEDKGIRFQDKEIEAFWLDKINLKIQNGNCSKDIFAKFMASLDEQESSLDI